MHNKIYAVLCTLLVVSAMVIPAFATEVSEPEGEEVVMDCLEPSESVSEPSGRISEPSDGASSSGYSLDGATVNVSEESIQAIADAVAGDGYDTFSFTNKLGETYTVVYPGLSDLLAEYPYMMLVHGTNNYYDVWFFSDIPEPSLAQYSDYFRYKPDVLLHGSLGNTSLTTWTFNSSHFNEAPSLQNVTTDISRIRYSNFDFSVTCAKGNVISYVSDARSYTVSFVTGFEDLVIDSQVYDDNFVLPKPEYIGYVFEGWYLDSALTQKYNFESILSDTTLYAKWVEVPPMSFVHQTIFDSLIVFVSAEPIFYIFSLMGLAMIIAALRAIISSRY